MESYSELISPNQINDFFKQVSGVRVGVARSRGNDAGFIMRAGV